MVVPHVYLQVHASIVGGLQLPEEPSQGVGQECVCVILKQHQAVHDVLS